MKRSRGFILSEILMTMILQAGFILTLFGAFYLMMEFYTKTQAVLTARDHAERVIQFMDDKIRAAGLGLWACGNSSEKVRESLSAFTAEDRFLEGFRLPVALTVGREDPEPQYLDDKKTIQYGNVLTLIYGAKDNSTSDYEVVLIVTRKTSPVSVSGAYESKIQLIDNKKKSKNDNVTQVKKIFHIGSSTLEYLESYAVTEATGLPMYVKSLIETGDDDRGELTVHTYGSSAESIEVADGSELIPMRCIQIAVEGTNNVGHGRQLTFREPIEVYTTFNHADWGSTYNQEMNILDIYMELDIKTKILSLYVLAQGGYDAGVTNPRPKAWPENATWTEEYSHYTVYVSRASWKLNNIPEDFKWN